MLTQTEIHQDDSGIAIVKFTGRLTLGSSMSLAESKINQLIDGQGVLKIIFDLASVEFMDSAGLGLVIYMHGKLREKGGQLRLASPNPHVLDLFRMTHTAALLQIDSDTHESAERLKL